MLTYDTSFAVKHGRTLYGGDRIDWFDQGHFSSLNSQYLIVRSRNSTTIFNVAKQQIVRTIPKADVRPADAGHILVGDHVRKDRYTNYSLQSLN
jgi:hypothetical protein